MDRQGRKLTRGACLLVTLVALAGCRAVEPALGPAEIAWTFASPQTARLLTNHPTACEPLISETPASAGSARRGALLFSSPFLLGGQAAKAGLSCSSCHVAGRGNPDFVFAGLSGAPGTADVTHGLFGPIRDDGVFNPVEIPDLTDAAGRKLDRADDKAIAAFLRAQIAEEFEGTPPSDSMVRDLGAFLKVLDSESCRASGAAPLRAETVLQDAIDAYRASNDPDLPLRPDRVGYALAARHTLGRLHARYAAPEDRDLREALEAAGRAIGDGAPEEKVLRILDSLRDPLIEAEPRSLYSERVLSDWIRD